MPPPTPPSTPINRQCHVRLANTPGQEVSLGAWWWWWFAHCYSMCVFLHSHARRTRLVMGGHVPVDMTPGRVPQCCPVSADPAERSLCLRRWIAVGAGFEWIHVALCKVGCCPLARAVALCAVVAGLRCLRPRKHRCRHDAFLLHPC